MEAICYFSTNGTERAERSCVLSSLSHVQLFVTLWTEALQSPLSMGFSRQEYWSGLPCPAPENLPDLGIELMSLNISCIGFFNTSTNWEARSAHMREKINLYPYLTSYTQINFKWNIGLILINYESTENKFRTWKYTKIS